MSQSLNGYPWRVQAGNVPFFTFPSTPPSFLPANSYPYTFAPVPPFSINQIAQVPTTAVPVPSYAGIAVPQATGVDSIVAGPNGATFPVAAIPSLTDVPGEHFHSVPPGVVAVTIANANPMPGQPATATVVIQPPPVMQEANGAVQSQDMAVIHAIGPPPPPHGLYQAPSIPAHLAPAIITAEGPQVAAGVIQNPGPPVGGNGVAVGRYHRPMMAAIPPQLVSVGAPPHNMMGVSLDYSMNSADGTQGHANLSRPRAMAREHQAGEMMQTEGPSSSSHFPSHANQGLPGTPSRNRILEPQQRLALFNNGAGPSRTLDSDSSSDNDSLDSNSPSRNFASMLYGSRPYPNFDNDSDDSMDNPIELESAASMMYGHSRELSDLSPDSQMSSDVDDSSPSESDSGSPTNPSTLRLINGTATVVISPVSDILQSSATESPGEELNSRYQSDENASNVLTEAEGVASSDESDPLTLPVLINISDSDSLNSQVDTPTSIIDLTSSSSLADSPSIGGDSAPASSQSSLTGNPPSHNQQILESSSYSEMHANAPVFVPVINTVEEVSAPLVASRRETTGYYVSPQVAVRVNEPATNGSRNQQVHVINQPMMQLPHAQLYAPQARLAAGHAHVITQQQLQPLPHAYNAHHSHSHSNDHHNAQSAYHSYPTHLPPNHTGSGNGGSLQVQAAARGAVVTLAPVPPPRAAVLPLESTAATATAMGHGNVHVMSWQQALSHQQQQHQAGQSVLFTDYTTRVEHALCADLHSRSLIIILVGTSAT